MMRNAKEDYTKGNDKPKFKQQRIKKTPKISLTPEKRETLKDGKASRAVPTLDKSNKIFPIVGKSYLLGEPSFECVNVPTEAYEWVSEKNEEYIAFLCAVKNKTRIHSIRTQIRSAVKKEKQIIIYGENEASVESAAMAVTANLQHIAFLNKIQNHEKLKNDDYAAIRKAHDNGIQISFRIQGSKANDLLNSMKPKLKQIRAKTQCKITIDNNGLVTLNGTPKSVLAGKNMLDFAERKIALRSYNDRIALTSNYLKKVCMETRCSSIQLSEIDDQSEVLVCGLDSATISAVDVIEKFLYFEKPRRFCIECIKSFQERLFSLENADNAEDDQNM